MGRKKKRPYEKEEFDLTSELPIRLKGRFPTQLLVRQHACLPSPTAFHASYVCC